MYFSDFYIDYYTSITICLFIGGPGSGKATQCQLLVERYTGWVHISIGDMLRKQILSEGTANVKWAGVADLVQKGEMAPQVYNGFYDF